MVFTQRALTFLLLILGASVPLFAAGSYGLNKVQEQPFAWKQVQTKHFDLYFYQGGDSLAAYAASNIEELYEESALYLGHRLRQRIPILLHNTHAQFAQTNVIRFPLPEAVGGFTEVFKNRIVLPFDGSYLSFRHVLQHELLHAMVFDLVSHGRRGYSTAAKLGSIPLWFNEGSSELGSLGWDLGSEFYMIDAVASGYVANPAQNLGGFLAYKGGQSFLYFVEETWGKGTVASLFATVAEGIPFPTAFLRATRVSLEEAGEIWLRELRRIYWPELGKRQYAKSIARPMTDHRKDESFYNVNPALSPDGKRLAFFSDRGNYEAVYILDTETEKITRTAVESGHRASHESFHPFRSTLGWAADNRHIVLTSKVGAKNVLHVVDSEKSRVVASIEAEGLEAMASPTVSPDGWHIVVSGQRQTQQNLYLLTLPAQVGHEALRGRVRVVPRALTQDRYSAERPCYSPSGRYVAFQSNRDDIKDARIQDKQEVYLLDLKSKAVQRLTTGRWGNHSPRFGREDGQIYFVSNRSGIDNLYLLHWKSDSLWPITNLSSAISGPSLAADGRSAAFAVFEEGGWDIYLLKDPELMRRNTPLPRSRFIEVAEDTTGQERFFAPIALHNLKSYRSQSSMDSLERVLQSKKEGQAESAGDNRVEPNTSLDDDGFFLDPVPASADSQSQAPLKKDTLTQDSASQRIAPGWADNDSLDVFLQDAQPFREDGSLFTKPYQAQWSMDQFVAVAGYSSSNGMGGEGLLTLTDLMGDQEVNLWFFGAGGLDNINLFIEYGYLPMRTDWRLAAFHTYSEGTERMSEARYEKLRGRDGGSDTLWGYAPYGDRNMGGALLTNYPLSLFSRISMGNQLTWRTRSWKLVEDESYSGSSWTRILKNDPSAAPEEANTWELSLGWSFDNAQWGVTGPMEGNRLWAGVQGIVPGVLQESMGYWRADMDMRKYFRVFRRYSFAFRAAGGLSESWDGHVNPHRYLVGGDAMTINWNVNWDHWRGTQNDIHFSSMETPLRGFRYNDFTGTRMGVLNAEFRFPLIDQLSLGWPIPLTITHVTGVLFSDFGGTWEDRRILENRGWSAGWGWRLNLGIFVLRYTRAWSHQEFSTVKRNDYTYWSLGAEF